MRRTRSQLRAAEIAALQAEQDAYEKNVNDAVKVAAFARCDAVEQLYELLEVEPELPIVRDGKRGRYEVACDKDETKRAARLIEAVAALLSNEEQVAARHIRTDGQLPGRDAQVPIRTTSLAPVATTPSALAAGIQPAG